MDGRGEQLATLDDPAAFDNGETVAFTIKTTTSKQMRVNCQLAMIGDIFSFLGRLAKAAGELRISPASDSLKLQNDYVAPIPAQGMGLQPGANPGKTNLVVRLHGFDMAFEVESSGIVRLADEFVRVARSLRGDQGLLH